jgi:hypothetical protein
MSASTHPAAAELLVCVYYRVRPYDVPSVTAQVRDIQRTLGRRFAGLQAQLLVRCEVRAVDPMAAPRDPGGDSAAAAAVDDTLMETYRLPLSALVARPHGGAALHAPEAARFLESLAADSAALAPRLCGARHVEVFMPCAS